MSEGTGNEADQFQSGDICFEFSVQCLCSAANVPSFQSMLADYRFMFHSIRLAQ